MKQVECNKCGRYFEVEGEWAYCPFCENDNVEVRKSLEDLIDEGCDDLDQIAERKESMALAYHGNSGFYFKYPDAYEYDLEREVERLHEELSLTEKALELACEELYDSDSISFCAYCPYDIEDECADECPQNTKVLEKYFKTKAKEMLDE